jgi:hypothetical protein
MLLLFNNNCKAYSRCNRILREFVKGKIVELAQDSFADILEDYEAQLSQV